MLVRSSWLGGERARDVFESRGNLEGTHTGTRRDKRAEFEEKRRITAKA
jgi:hypothetical protein